MLGNSYTQRNELQQLSADALEDVSSEAVGAKRLTRGGLTLADHAAQAEDVESEWYMELVSNAGSWDFVVLQDQSQIPGFPETESYWQASLEGAASLDGLIKAGNAETLFLLTWGRREGDPTNQELFPDFLAMQDRLLSGYLAYAEACTEPAWIVPAGLAFKEVYEDILASGQDPLDSDSAFYQLYDADSSHPALAGSYLASLSLAAALTGKSVASVRVPGSLDEDLASYLKSCADAAILDAAFEEIPYRWAHEWEDWSVEHGTVVSDTLTRPLVRVGQPTSEGSLVVGEEGADGRLLITSSLEVGSLTGSGEVIVEGTLVARELDLSALIAAGSADLGGGTVGLLELMGTLELHPGELIVCEQALLSGLVKVEQDPLEELELLRASDLDITGLEWDLPEGCELEERSGSLWILSGSSEGSDAEDQKTPEECGCSHSSGAFGLWAVLISLFRRRD